MITSEDLKKFVSAGYTPEQILLALSVFEDVTNRNKITGVTNNNAIRQRRYRERRNSHVMERDGKCVYCGSLENLTIDHVIPLCQGGSSTPDNLCVACETCNKTKGGRTPEQWRNNVTPQNVTNKKYQDSTLYTKEVSKKESKISKNTASRFTLDALPPEWKYFCNQKRPDLNPECTFDSFRDWWIAVPGQKGMKMDWFATWRTWVRNQRVETKANGYAKFENKPIMRVESLEDKAKRSEILRRYQI